MAIGMTYEQYWYGDPLMVRAFYQAHKLKQQRMNEEAWLNGVYVYRALSATVGNVFLKKGAQPVEYPEKPIEFESKVDTPQSEEQEVVYAQAYMMNMVAAGKNWKK